MGRGGRLTGGSQPQRPADKQPPGGRVFSELPCSLASILGTKPAGGMRVVAARPILLMHVRWLLLSRPV